VAYPQTAKTILSAVDISRIVDRVAHQILEKTEGAADTVLLGIPTRGCPLATRLAAQPATVFAQEAASAAGPAVDTVTFASFNVDQAPLNIQNGDMDLYLFSLKTAGAKSAPMGRQSKWPNSQRGWNSVDQIPVRASRIWPPRTCFRPSER
jgi:hypothetical protein